MEGGDRIMSFLQELKIAVINEDYEKLHLLSKEMPSISSVDEAKEVLVYIYKAIEMLSQKRAEMLEKMQKIDKLKKFNEQEKKSNFDIQL